MYTPDRFYSTDQIIRHSSGKTHFFDVGAKRFFNSRIGQSAYSTNNPFVTLFTTSEKYENRWSQHYELRKYTIRSYDWRTGSVDTVGKFQQFNSARQAVLEIEKIRQTIEYSLEDQHEYALLLNQSYDYARKKATQRGETKFYVSDLGYVSLLTNRHFFGTME